MIRLGLGEGPLWHPVANRLYVTDIYHRALHVFDADLTRLHTHVLSRLTSAMTWQADGSLLLFHDRGGISRWQDGKDEVLIDSLPDEEGSRFNDVIADPLGRVLCGTEPVGTRPGRLYSIGPDLQPRLLIDEVQEPNGLGFSPDNTQLYFTDSVAQTIWRFPYAAATGSLGERVAFFRTANGVLPDGLTVDLEGNVWTALWNGGGVLRISSDGKNVLKHSVPARRSTSLTFGGAGFSTLFVTSARDHGDTTPNPFDGALFALDGCGVGRAELSSRLGE
jgi:D-xylonolactonase